LAKKAEESKVVFGEAQKMYKRELRAKREHIQQAGTRQEPKEEAEGKG
jgi:hypothetical protein